MNKRGLFGILVLIVIAVSGCEQQRPELERYRTITDQLGQTVRVPVRIERIAALNHFGGRIIYALGQQSKQVGRSLYGREAAAMARLDPAFEKLPDLLEGSGVNTELLVGLRPQVIFVYASFAKEEMEQLKNAGMTVFALLGETLEQSFRAVHLVGEVLGCPDRAEQYASRCRKLMALVDERVSGIPADERLKVMFTGPKGIFTVATGEMLQSEVLNRAGAINTAASVKGFWADVSPEQIAVWNPDVIFLGSSLDTYDVESIFHNTQFQTVAAVRQKRVYPFPSNIGWWDFPAPHCALGVLWAAKTLYPNRFADIDMLDVANEYYVGYMGHSFTAMGGRL